MEELTLCVEEAFDGKRIDVFLVEKEVFGSRSFAQKQCDEGKVTVNGKVVPKSWKVHSGEEVEILLTPPVQLDVIPQDIKLDIVYEDDSLLVVNKPKDMVVHPAAGNLDGTLVNALLYHCQGNLSGINGVIRPGIVHRIDKDTSGLLLVAKTDRAHLSLSEQIKEHSCDRFYEAVVYGNFKQNTGTINAPIGRHPQRRKEMCINERNGRQAVTHFEVLAEYQGFTHLRVKLETGRTHQIRVHMSHIDHPVAGDEVYGPKKVIKSLQGQCLHAKTIACNHPVSGERMSFDSSLPEYFTAFLKTLRPL